MKKLLLHYCLLTCLLILASPMLSAAAGLLPEGLPEGVVNDQRYNRAIHIMAMLLIGGGLS